MSAPSDTRRATPRVFISYRRDESAGHAGRIYDALAARFGERQVFMDVDLAPGIDYVERIRAAVGDCDALLVVIGPRWARMPGEGGGPRLAEPDDVVRLELETALSDPRVSVIPLLVAGARMPETEELPASLHALSRRNALELSDMRWRYDVGRLVDTLEQVEAGGEPPPPTAATPPGAPARPRRRRALLGAGVALAAAVLLVALLAAAGVFSGGGTESETDGGEPTATAELTTDDAAERAQDYLRAFGSGDVRALRGMLDPNVVLKEADATTDGSDAVVANHQQTLSRLGGKQLEFSWDVENTDANEGKFSASGPYVLFADGVPEQRGEIGVRLEQTGSRLLITEICLDCPELTTKGDYPPR